jgi:glycosyltransferase involved in cell wall biosynthesis
MLGVLHLYPARCDFQTQRCLELLLKNLGTEMSMTASSLGPGGDFGNLPVAIFRLRSAGVARTHIAHAWGPAELAAAAAAGFSRIVFSPQGPIHPEWWPWIGAIFRRRDVEIVCPTSALRDVFISHGAPAGRCRVISPAVDVSRFNGSGRKLRSSLGLADSDIVLLAPGESTRGVFHNYSLWAAAILNVLDPQWRLLIWGRGPMVDSLERFAATVGRDSLFVDAEKRLGSAVDFEQIACAADAALVFADAKAPVLPLSTCMAAGVPIVAAETAGSREFLQNQITALLEPSATPRKLAERMLALQKDPALRRKIAEAARLQAIDRFSVARYVADWRGVYNQLRESNAFG